ncbi:MAG TPA: UDP-N-acetylmuramate--L-alanine ligase [Kiritimatiellae bacterium]|nr:UDP-N-acetylmuramate--L-alanine ligase [Kiritimatiellia bacterium]
MTGVSIRLEQLQEQARQAAQLLQRRGSALHLVGIGGVGMAGLALLLRARGHHVDGCDRSPGKLIRWLRKAGIRVAVAHDPAHLQGADGVVRTSAVPDSSPEIRRAEETGTPVLLRGTVVAALSSIYRTVAVTGSHGKTTTTAMLFQILRGAGVTCNYLGGGWDRVADGPAAAGGGDMLVAEADESDGTIGCYCASFGVITNMEFDHSPAYGDRRNMAAILRRFAGECRGALFFPAADPVCGAIADAAPGKRISFGLSPDADVGGRLRCEYPRCVMDVYERGVRRGSLELSVGGRHNAANALAAVAVALHLGVEFEAITEIMGRFLPVARRFDRWTTAAGIAVISDYAHHPTEIAYVLRGIRAGGGGRLWVIFQPHRYSRTRQLKDGFVRVLSTVDRLYLTPVFAASETVVAGGTTDDLARGLRQRGSQVNTAGSPLEAWMQIRPRLERGDVLLLLGAGDIEDIVEKVLGDLGGSREAEHNQ